MPIVTLKEALDRAQKEKYGIGAFNVTSLTYLEAVIKAAEDNNSPVILQIGEGQSKNAYNLEAFCAALKVLAVKSPVPIVLHLDHGKTLSTVMRCIKNGFSSIMIDASHKPYRENVEETLEIVKLCHSIGISVEGELGTLGGQEEGLSDEEAFTNPEEALNFVKETGVDALAVSIGNVHGNYKGEPRLDFLRLKKIAELISVPVVLHGGSGISDEDFQKAISLGICKINFYTGNSKAGFQAVLDFAKEDPVTKGTDIMKLFQAMKANVYKSVTHNMGIFGSINKAWLVK